MDVQNEDEINESKETDQSFNDIEMFSTERTFDDLVIILIFNIYSKDCIYFQFLMK